MSWSFKLPGKDARDYFHYWRLLRALDEERTEDLPLHQWNLGYHHTKWDNWPPKDWSAIPTNRKRVEEVEDRFTYTFDFLGPFKISYPADDCNKVFDPYDEENEFFMYKDERLSDLKDEMDILYERLINRAISNLNNHHVDSLVKEKFTKLKKEVKQEDDEINTTDSEEVPFDELEGDQFYNMISKKKIEYRRSTLEDIEMPSEFKDEILGELNKVIDDLVDSRLRKGYHNNKEHESFDWKNVLHSIIAVTKDCVNPKDHHLNAKDNILKLFEIKLDRPPMPEPDCYFNIDDDVRQVEDANIALWRDNIKRLDTNQEFENTIRDQLQLEKESLKRNKSWDIENKEPTVDILNFSKSVVGHFKTQAVKLNARKQWLDKFKKLDEVSKEYFEELKTDASAAIKKAIRDEKKDILDQYTNKILETLEEPRPHINPMVYNLKNYKSKRKIIPNYEPHKKLKTKPVKFKLKRFASPHL